MITASPDRDRQKMASRYTVQKRWLSAAQIVIVFTIFIVLVFIDITSPLSVLAPTQPWTSALYFLLLIISLIVILTPFSYYEGFILPRRYGLSTQNIASWLKDGAKSLVLALIIGELVVIITYTLLVHFPYVWWLWGSALVFTLTILASMLAPALIIPLFYGIKPLNDDDLRKRIVTLSEKAKTSVKNVYMMKVSSKSTTANAMLAGIGRTRRIILTDTLLNNYTPDEIEAVIAHELGHNIHKDIPRLIVINAFVITAGFGIADIVLRAAVTQLDFSSIADARGLPLLMLVFGIFGFLIGPALNTFSRTLEMNADMTALELTRNPQAFISAMTKLTDQNLSEAQPNRLFEVLFHDHPTYVRRVELARRFISKDEKETRH